MSVSSEYGDEHPGSNKEEKLLGQLSDSQLLMKDFIPSN
jgi:hypothetical protein